MMKAQVLADAQRRIDFTILIATVALLAIGLLSMYSATHGTAVLIKFQKQIFWLVLGLLLVILVMLAPPRFFHYSAYFIYGFTIVSLILVLILGKTVSGNAGWFGIGTYGIQPSEFAKLGTIAALARYLSDRATNISTFRNLLIAIGIVFLPWFLIFIQPDFGTGLVYWAFFLPMIFWAGAEMILLLTLASPVIIALLSILNLWLFLAAAVTISVLFYIVKRNIGIALLFLSLNLAIGFGVQYFYEHLPEYQKARVTVFLDPSRSPQNAGYNVIQSKVAVGSGGLIGRGYLKGSQTQLRFVPEQWTDFIFCVPAEEFGFIGGMSILGLFGLLFFRGIRIARANESRFSSLLSVGITAMLVAHVFINVSMTLGMLPVVGIPLPFLSYGGSFMITALAGIGLLLHAHANRTQDR